MKLERTTVHFTDPLGSFEHTSYRLEEALVALVVSAKSSIALLSYSLPTWSRDWFLAGALEQALARGVSVKVYSHQYSNVARLVSRYRDRFDIAGWHWNEDDGDLFHIKGIMIDDVKLYLGSANLSKNGIAHSAEWGVVTTSPDLCLELNRYTTYLISNRKLSEV